jgi:hypothetical protein
MNTSVKTPIAFFIFKRPDTTERVFEAIRQARPPKLLVVADGPRADRPDEPQLCGATRAVLDRIDWDCEVLTNYAETNLGCKNRVSSGLDWVFNQVEEAIILEDDCLPHPSFFAFCETLLDRYRYDERIFLISGQNVQMGRRVNEYDYYFSRYTHCWGWATWRRSWLHYDVEMKLWPTIRDHQELEGILMGDRYAIKVWRQVFEAMYTQQIDTWDYQLLFACWMQNGLTILPNVKLVENIGFGPAGTHTTTANNPYASIPLEGVTLPLKHPPYVIRSRAADYFTQRTLYNYRSNLFKRVYRKLIKLAS